VDRCGAAPVLERAAETRRRARLGREVGPAGEPAAMARVELRAVDRGLHDLARPREADLAGQAAVLDPDHDGKDEYCGDYNPGQHGSPDGPCRLGRFHVLT